MPLTRRLFGICSTVTFLFAASAARATDDYKPGPDSSPQPGVPVGEVTKYVFDNSRIFPGTTREYWVYVPRQYNPGKPACLFVDQDGVQFKAPVVFDNLIARGEMPVTIGVFIMHGRVKAESTNALDRFNRSYEYDGLGPNYARFLLEEILPEVETKKTADGRPILLSKDPNDRAIGGSSSGAICAFTAAWERPDAFRRVFSSIGTFVDQRGGNTYPALIRKTEAKPLRVFLQDGTNDLNIYGGNWHLANEEMLSALEYAGYEVNHIWGDGGHNGKQATAIFPDAMRWLWKDWPAPVEAGVHSRQPVAQIVSGSQPWKVVAQGFNATGLTVNAQGEVFFYDGGQHSIWKISPETTPAVFAHCSADCRALAFGPDGRLYAALNSGKIEAFDSSGTGKTAGGGVEANAMCIGHDGNIYLTEPAHERILMVDPHGKKKIIDTGTAFFGGLCMSPDQSLLQAADSRGTFIYSFHINPDGALSAGQPFYHLEIPDAVGQSGAGSMAMDENGTLYVATHLGVQVCDQAGRVQGIIALPPGIELSNIAFGGAKFDEMYGIGGNEIFRRKVNATGVLSFQPPTKPAAPHL